MTTTADNIYSGFKAATSAAQSASPVALRKSYRFTQPAGGGANPITVTGTFPPNTENLNGALYIIANSSATVSDKITVSAAGTDLIRFTSFGSAQGFLGSTTTGLGTLSVIASACYSVTPPATGQTNGGEIPFSITFTPVSASRGDYQVVLMFNRMDRNFPA